jgi:hypothetical protein
MEENERRRQEKERLEKEMKERREEPSNPQMRTITRWWRAASWPVRILMVMLFLVALVIGSQFREWEKDKREQKTLKGKFREWEKKKPEQDTLEVLRRQPMQPEDPPQGASPAASPPGPPTTPR